MEQSGGGWGQRWLGVGGEGEGRSYHDIEWKCEASILDNQWRRSNATHPQVMRPKNSATTPMCSIAPPPSALSSTHSPPMPPTPSSKLAVDPQPMDLDCMKSKNPPQTCYNCNKLGHIAWNCLRGVLGLHTIQVHGLWVHSQLAAGGGGHG